jgi:hypothetical protein
MISRFMEERVQCTEVEPPRESAQDIIQNRTFKGFSFSSKKISIRAI